MLISCTLMLPTLLFYSVYYQTILFIKERVLPHVTTVYLNQWSTDISPNFNRGRGDLLGWMVKFSTKCTK